MSDFALEDGKFIRKADRKHVARLEGGSVKGLHWKLKKHQAELEALAVEALMDVMEEGPIKAPEGMDEDVRKVERDRVIAEIQEVKNRVHEEAPSLAEKIATDPDETPRELFNKSTSEQTPAVIEWRRENWTAEKFAHKYPTK